METITYKGYIGEYQQYNDGEDSMTYFAGEIPSVSKYAKVLFEGENMEELTEDFHSAVEDCIAQGFKPVEKSHKVAITGFLYTQLTAKAKQNGVSVTNYINKVLASVVL